MRPRAPVALLAIAAAAGCSKDEGGGDSYDARLEVTARAADGSSTVPQITCPMTIRIEREDEMRFTGTFERRACDRTVRPTVDAQGRVRGFGLPDGTATLTFDKPPLTTRSQVSSTVECPEELTAAVFTGQIHRESLRLENRFRVTCLAPSAAREVFEVVYLVEGTRN